MIEQKRSGRAGFLIVAVLLGLAAASAPAQTIWTQAVSGSWSDATMWSAGVPSNTAALLTATGASYAVQYGSAQPAITNLTLSNSAPYRTELIVSAPLTNLGGSAIRLRAGANVTITNGGLWMYDGTNAVTDRGESMLSIRDGAELVIAGGAMAFTNLPLAAGTYGNYINVGYQSTGSLRVTSGRLHFFERIPRANTNDFRALRIGAGVGGVGTLEVSGGSVSLGMSAGGGESLSVGVGSAAPAGSTRGTAVVSGGELVFTNNNGWNLLKIGANYGEGIFVVTNSGSVNLRAGNVSARAYVGASPNGCGLLRVDGGSMNIGDGATVGYNNGYSGAVWATGIVEVTAGTLDVGAGLVLGYGENASGGGNGVGVATISGGRIIETYWGVFVGRSRAGGVASGRLAITSGSLEIRSATEIEAGPAPTGGGYAGLAIGVINFGETNPSSRARGEMTVSGSAIVTNGGSLVIGINNGTGTLTQTGGTIRHAPQGSSALSRFTILGYGYGTNGVFGGGDGTYTMTGGSYYTPNRVFIGGVPTNIQSFSRTGGVGLLQVSGGAFTTDGDVMVGGNGSGTLAIGSNGVCTVRDLVLTNNTAGTLRFVPGPGTLGTLKVNGNLYISPDAKLQVDLSGIGSWKGRLRLVDCATRAGSFSAANITVIGAQATVEQGWDEDIWLHVPAGTMIIYR